MNVFLTKDVKLITISKLVLPFTFALLMAVGLFYRLSGLGNNVAFWTDESHVAIFVRATLEKGTPVLQNGYSTGIFQWLQYWLSAISAKILGLNEFAVRLPSILFGVATIYAVNLLGVKLFNKKVGLLSSILITFLNIEILWSRQARPYQALQLLLVFTAYFAIKLANKGYNRSDFISLLSVGILASLFHVLGLLVIFNGIVYFAITNYQNIKAKILPVSIILGIMTVIFWLSLENHTIPLGKVNNLYYYRIFLTHNYLSISILSLFGFLWLVYDKKYRESLLFGLFLGTQLLVVSFVLAMPFVRYLFIIFPFIILLSCYFIYRLTSVIRNRQLANILLLTIFLLTLFVLRNKMSFLPQQTYSLNEDMQEIPEVDWKIVYNFVIKTINNNPGMILITNWNDLPVWYLGENKLNYLIRKDIKTVTDRLSGAVVISNTDELNQIVRENQQGLIIVDSWDNMVTDGIREYCHKNLKLEYEIDRLYPIQPRYWTVWVYSWGLE